jgi:hypothetical protein
MAEALTVLGSAVKQPAARCAAPHATRAAPAGAGAPLRAHAPRLLHGTLRAPQRWRRAAEQQGPRGAGGADDDDKTYEPMRKLRAKGRLQAKVKVSTPTVDAVLGDAPPSETAQAETSAVLALTAVFLLIMVEGLLVAASGFMSEEWDGIIQARAAPARARAGTAAQQAAP